MNYEFRALENNGGGLHIIITDGGKLVYAATGFEHNEGDLSRIMLALYNDEDVESWDGNIVYDEEILKEIRREKGGAVTDDEGGVIPMTNDEVENFFGIDHEFGPVVVADYEGIYWDRMGGAARKDFGILTLAQVSELFENISIS